MHSHEITRQFVELGRNDALSHDPTDELDEGRLWHRASRVVRTRLEPCEAGTQVQLAACRAYREGWMWSYREMTTVPHLRITSHLWTIGYRSAEDRECLAALLQPGDEQAACRLLVDIRYLPLSPYHPEWSRKQLLARYRHRYRHLRALGNKHYHDPGLPIRLVDEQAGLVCLAGFLQAGWDIVLLCACADAKGCHRTLVAEHLQQQIGDDPRIRIHVSQRADL